MEKQERITQLPDAVCSHSAETFEIGQSEAKVMQSVLEWLQSKLGSRE